ncbi:MAG: nucleotide exchange factor GrpE [Candidatus Zambryskibacteria bacterium RIFCSPLOWO2_12_FULL_39_45]|uniref:Protein GrpE n=2 Tax=Candidatus Zambryskiibacteriota TaxID=1817925 RepID=A0A1G2UVA5_9BACT|nr:MAG: Protein GrpE [Parcubacteria group bacterium GW2011_GWA2_40_14]OHA96215.1 MAG: nucleotide exchange factor GrpE [Candidatus Zambryskibacteria bacterium RIFCSPHIGHO2_02_FULL_39_82]OHA98423.1 MAG: nucleotide exchange factor GrpE [Candidatus Zambryskibacteria bacterium RIFCSPHIGHO2_12_FULL_38_37]OHB09191.1 MAG: nucleotide exchange factor GrpE [Candidatus Zambryskibacteria bacterium RIFCSPLOWO2_02_39_10]OHB10761.1 MAG: nucleotide exchange factor GrpE [Candidatus Zambryskibacteria bacterium RI
MKDDEKKLNIEPEVDTDPGDETIDDVVFEDNTEVTGADYNVKVSKLRNRIKELEKKNVELLDGWQRDKAEFVNSRKRDEEQKKEFIKFSKADTIAELLPVLDSFESAFKNKETWESVDKNWRTGVEYIHSQLFGILAGHGLKVINPLGEMYDHSRDEAVENIKVEIEADNNKILEVVQVGYEFNGKEIRAPKVKVGQFGNK